MGWLWLASFLVVVVGCYGTDSPLSPDVLVPRIFRIDDPSSGRALKLYFHNAFDEYAASPCLRYDNDHSGCGGHPRCHIENMSPNVAQLQPPGTARCVLAPEYLKLIATPGVCEMAHISPSELKAVIHDMEREGHLSHDLTRDFESACGHIRRVQHSLGAAKQLVGSYAQAVLANNRDGLASQNANQQQGVHFHNPSVINSQNWDTYHDLSPLGNSSPFRGNRVLSHQASLMAPSPMFARHEGLHLTPQGSGFQYIAPAELLKLPLGVGDPPHRPACANARNNICSDGEPPLRIGINGFGRIGRLVLLAAINRPDITVKHINAMMPVDYMAHLLSHDIFGQGNSSPEISFDFHRNVLLVNGHPIQLSSALDVTHAPWVASGVDFVVETSGSICTSDSCFKDPSAEAALDNSLSPSSGYLHSSIPSVKIVACRSCGSNGLTPLVRVLQSKFQGKEALMSTVHAGHTAHYAPGAPLPTVEVSVLDLDCHVANSVTFDELKAIVKDASETYLKGFVDFSEESNLSAPKSKVACSSVFSSEDGSSLNTVMSKLVELYDAEWSSTNHLLDLIAAIASRENGNQLKMPRF